MFTNISTDSLLMFRFLPLLFVGMSTSCAVEAGFWRFQEEFVGRTNVEHHEVASVIFEYFEKHDDISDADVRRDLLTYYRRFLEAEAVEIRFKTERNSTGKSTVVAEGVVYFAKGELVIMHSACDPQHAEFPINYVTIQGRLYEWRFGETTGRVLKRYPGDTVELLDYILDPAMLKRFMYTEFRKTSPQWERRSGDNEDAFFPKMRAEIQDAGLVSVGVVKRPFWLRSLTYRQPAKPRAGEITFTVETPRILKLIPDELKTLPVDVEFKESDATAEWRLKYW